ncbi:UNVERIFIED_CONTAM: Alcohol dehydrogenase 1 [Sesamum calycinum]|uniref:alcohol dehydrogenase n=1 Tax=Sesamum calycinum TaxID=2727403 RepID=A0AAW2PAA0_9LAMI
MASVRDAGRGRRIEQSRPQGIWEGSVMYSFPPKLLRLLLSITIANLRLGKKAAGKHFGGPNMLVKRSVGLDPNRYLDEDPSFLAFSDMKLEGLGAILNVAKPTKGSIVAAFGLGAVGLAAAEGPRIVGASRIIAIDLNPNRFGKI